MGTFNSAVLPASTGLQLGSPTQSWNVYANTLTVASTTTFTSVTSGSPNPAKSGKVQLASADAINFRNNANSGDVNGLSKNSSDVVVVGGSAGVSIPGPVSLGALQTQLRAGATGSITLLNQQGPLAPVTGTALEVALYTYTLPAATLLAGQGVRITAAILHSTGAASFNMKGYFGAAVVNFTYNSVGTGDFIRWVVFNNSGSTTAQNGMAEGSIAGATLQQSPFTASQNTANPVTIKLTFNVANTDQVTPQFWLVELVS